MDFTIAILGVVSYLAGWSVFCWAIYQIGA
jgi:hypothetical protein